MPRVYTYREMLDVPSPRPPRRRYGFGSFLLDFVMTCLTGGFWLIWIFVREMRSH